MKKLIILLFAISITAFGQQPSRSLEGKIILMLKNNASLTDSDKANDKNKIGNSKIDEINRLYQSIAVIKEQLGRRTNKCIYIIQFPEGTNLKPIIDAYYETGEIEYAEPDYVGTLGGTQEVIPNDHYYFRQWGLHNDGTFPPGVAVAGCDMDMQNAWEIEQGDSTIIVGILDTGVKFDHPELAGRTWINYDEIPGNLIDDDENEYIDDVQGWNFAGSNNIPVDGNGHGTNIAGIIGANGNNAIGYSGIDWNCKLMILKGFTDGGGGNVSWWANAIYYAVDNGARIINMSFGNTNNSTTLMDAVNYALENNVVLVACMMNSNSNTVFYPAAYNGVIAVGSTDWDDTRSQPFFNGSPGSNYGSHISVVAPGNVIFSLDYLSNTNYEIHFSGTSQATANISGVASLLLAQDSHRTPDDIKLLIESTAEDMVGDPLEDTPGWDQYYGFGRANAYYALISAQTCLPEGITFTTQEQIDNFQTNYPGCTEIEGEVIISGPDITNLIGLSMVTKVDSNLIIIKNNQLTNLSGLDALTFVGGYLEIGDVGDEGNPVLTSLTGLEGLTSTGHGLTIRFNPALTSFHGLENLTSLGSDGFLLIQVNDALTDLTALSNLTNIGGSLRVEANAILTSLAGLENIDPGSVGTLFITRNPMLNSCGVQSICDYLANPTGTVYIMDNAPGCEHPADIAVSCGTTFDCLPYGFYHFYSQSYIDNFHLGFPNCTVLNEYAVVFGDDITNLNGLSQITGVNGGLRIDYNPLLTDLTGLSNVTYVNDELWIEGNDILSSLAGLQNIRADSLNELRINDNPLLSACEVESICDYLNIPNSIVTIGNNAPGCNSPEEVEAACEAVGVEEVTGVASIQIIPNPAGDIITVSWPMPSGKAQLTLFNITGEKLIEKQITRAESSVNISTLSRGVYFVRLQNEKMVEVAKMIKE